MQFRKENWGHHSTWRESCNPSRMEYPSGNETLGTGFPSTYGQMKLFLGYPTDHRRQYRSMILKRGDA